MTEQAIYSTFSFKDKNTGELLRQLTLRNLSNKMESIKRTLSELTEKYCLAESEIVVEGL